MTISCLGKSATVQITVTNEALSAAETKTKKRETPCTNCCHRDAFGVPFRIGGRRVKTVPAEKRGSSRKNIRRTHGISPLHRSVFYFRSPSTEKRTPRINQTSNHRYFPFAEEPNRQAFSPRLPWETVPFFNFITHPFRYKISPVLISQFHPVRDFAR